MMTLPIELEQQVIHFAEVEELEPIAFLKNVVADYVTRATNREETLFLRGVEASLAEEWSDGEDEANFNDN